MISIQEFELARQSQQLLSELGKSLASIFDVDRMEPNPEIESLLKKLDDVPSSRDLNLERSDARICRLLGKSKT